MNLVEEARKYAISEMERFGLPDSVHFEISEKKAVELAKEFKADEDVILAGVYLMDVKLGETFRAGEPEKHIQASVDATEEFLQKFDLDQDKKEKIINCVEAHHGTVPYKSIEAEICANADCYRFLHPKGVFAFLSVLSGEGRDQGVVKNLETVEYKMDEKYNILSLDICKKELEDYYQTFKKYIEVTKTQL